ncbi:MAG: hypothetical protein WA728_21425 [Xanthobacteraceae bacterium]
METMETISLAEKYQQQQQQQQQQLNREVVQQLNEAKYASLTSRAVSHHAHTLINRLIKLIDEGEEKRGSRKNKRSEKAQLALRRTMEGFVGDLLRAYADKKSGGWVYRSRKANSFSGGEISYRNFITVLKSLGDYVETKVGYQEWSNGFDPGGGCRSERRRRASGQHRGS